MFLPTFYTWRNMQILKPQETETKMAITLAPHDNTFSNTIDQLYENIDNTHIKYCFLTDLI